MRSAHLLFPYGTETVLLLHGPWEFHFERILRIDTEIFEWVKLLLKMTISTLTFDS